MTQNNTPAAAPLTTRQNAQALVSAGISSYRTGDRGLAEQFFQQAVELAPDHADALQLMGMIAKEKGDLPAAEAWMTKSLQADPRQPHVHHNLGNVLLARGAHQEALDHYSEAVRQKSDYLEALIRQGEVLCTLGRFEEAEKPYKTAFRLKPDDVSAVVSLADLYANTGRVAEGEKMLRDALKKQPGNPFYLNNLGQLLSTSLRFAEAVQVMQSLPNLMPNQPEVFVNLANALLGIGQAEEAIANYTRAIQLDPLNYFAHANLNDLLWQSGRKEEAGRSFAYAKRVLPNHPDVLEMSAECMLTIGQLEQAEADLLAAERLRPGTLGQFRLWTALRLAQGRPDAAAQVAAAGLNQNPQSVDLLGKLAEALLRQDVPEQALHIARRMEEVDPVSQFAVSFQVNSLRLLGEEAEAQRLYDYQRFVHSEILPVPDLKHLAEKLDALHHAQHEPVQQTLRNGTQTHESLFTRPGVDPAIVALGQSILAAAKAYVAALPDDMAHPFLRRKAHGLDWAGSWSVRLNGGGHHVDHIHPKGWISGVFYVDLPDCLEDEAAKPGWIKFGEFARPETRSLSWEKAVRPQPGMVVFFPSYMTHGTLPTVGEQTRLTVSFDIVPA